MACHSGAVNFHLINSRSEHRETDRSVPTHLAFVCFLVASGEPKRTFYTHATAVTEVNLTKTSYYTDHVWKSELIPNTVKVST